MLTSGTRALFSSFTVESVSFWIGTEIFTCYLGLSGVVVGRALSTDCDSSVIGHCKEFVKMQKARQLQSRADFEES
ncbi:hypothetical protein QYF36_003606 [Acer negundo]|nr:hypothetical protein QYF36_003606 [Acer negundo]